MSSRTASADNRPARVRRRRLAVLALVLTIAALVMPNASIRTGGVMLVKVDTAQGIDGPDDVIWILALGSDARQGQPPLQGSRADAIQMIGVNLRTGEGSVIGIPRDSWVPIPGYGSDRINAAMYHGGPQLMADTVADLVGVEPDYVFTTTFVGFKAMIGALGGVTVNSDMAFTDDYMVGAIQEGQNRLDGVGALFFGRARHYLPNGDFDRSAHQQELLRGILREIRAKQDEPGFMERGALSVMNNLYTNLPPAELYRLGQAATRIDPAKLEGCVLRGSYGTVNGASIVFPDTAMAGRLGDEARDDATFDSWC
jgi:polyisoprenyl-teichoic acid--peptidoglycan teichoic acid transferase